MEMLLGFIGFTDIRSIVVEPTFGWPEDIAKNESNAMAAAEKIASVF